MFKLITFGYLLGSSSPMLNSKFYHEYNVPSMEMCRELEHWQHASFKHIHLLRTMCVETQEEQ